jgi:drug/metabolite transporter (DMT)-like permease
MQQRRPGPLVLVAFAFVVVVGGSNFVAVRFSNRELPPFYGAAVRFGLASLLLVAVLAVTRTALPRGRALTGAIVFGLLNFFAAYAVFYWGLQKVPAALGGVVFGTVPLLTLVLAVVQRQEPFRLRALLGSSIAVAGVAVMVGSPGSMDVPFLYLLAVIASAACAAEAAVVVKHYPPVPPIALNTVAMVVGTVFLFVLSAVQGERWTVPSDPATWWALAFLVPIGSVGLFIGYVYVVQRWTASGASYQFVLFPIVTAVTGALIADEPLRPAIAVGGVLVIAGTYVGALTGGRDERLAPVEPVG